MPAYSASNLTPEAQALFERARAGAITPAEFCRELDQQGVGGMTKMLYVRDAFGLSLERAKQVAHISDDVWVQELCDAVDEFSENAREEAPTAA